MRFPSFSLMNFLASYNWLKEYVALKETPEAFAARVSLSGPGIERLYPQGEAFELIVLGRIVSVEPHPQADKLRVAIVDVGSQRGLATLRIVCGGSNLANDQRVAVALPGAKVRWHGTGDPVELALTDIRGVKSEGMICAANEIGLFDAFPHKEREILDLSLIPSIPPGTPLARVLGYEKDVVMDVEVTTNRPDVMSMVGLAREASAILKRPFLWRPAALPKIEPSRLPLSGGGLMVRVANKKLCPRFMAIRIDGVRVGDSPWWLKRRLLSAGVRPISNIVDITNYVLLELGRPMHAFDAAKVAKGLVVRTARKGESLAALNGTTYDLNETMLVVADHERPLAIAGVMGGASSGVTLDTTSIIFESAMFDPVSVRRTSRTLNLFSDAQALFEKGLSFQSPPDGLARAVELCLELAGGTITSKVIDVKAGTYREKKFSITKEEIDRLIGVSLPIKKIQDTLERLGFKAKYQRSNIKGQRLEAMVPGWRDQDIESGRDLVEEVARVYGYANIPPIFPPAPQPQISAPALLWEDRLRAVSKGAGWTETYTYAFISNALATKAGYDPEKMIRLQNPLSVDFERLRTSLLPSLIQVLADNQERFHEQRLFEIANVFYPRHHQKPELPDEQMEFGGAVLRQDDLAFKEAKGLVERLLEECGLDNVDWKPLMQDLFWHPGRSAQAFRGETLLGTVGELHPLIAERFKLEGRCALIDLPLMNVFAHASGTKPYRPIPLFPEAKRDLAMVVASDIEVQTLERAMRTANPLLRSIAWFDTYRGEGVDPQKKSVAFHLTFGLADRTLETAEVDEALRVIKDTLRNTFRVELRS